MEKYYKKLLLSSRVVTLAFVILHSTSAKSIEPLGDFPGLALNVTGKDYLQFELLYGTLQCHDMQCMTVGGSVGYLPFAHDWSVNANVSLQILLMLHFLWSPGILLDHDDFEINGVQNWIGIGAGAILALARTKYDFASRQARWEFGVGIRYFFIN